MENVYVNKLKSPFWAGFIVWMAACLIFLNLKCIYILRTEKLPLVLKNDKSPLLIITLKYSMHLKMETYASYASA